MQRSHAVAPGSLAVLVSAGLGLLLGGYILTAVSLQEQWGRLLLLGGFAAFAAVISGNLRLVLMMVMVLGIPFNININYFYNHEMAALNSIGGLYLSATTMALAAAYGLRALQVVLGRASGPPFLGAVKRDWALTAYVALVLMSVLTASNRQLAVFEAFLLVQVVLFYLYIQYEVTSRKDVFFVTTLLLVGLLAEALVMIALPVIGHEVSMMSITARLDPNGRVGGTIGNPNGGAAFLTLLLAPGFGVLLGRGSKWQKLLAAACLFFGIAALILTLSRGGWLGFGLSMTILVLFAWRKRWIRPGLLLGTLLLLAVVVGALQGPIIARLTTSDAGAAYSRWPLIQLAARVIADQPLTGVGANNFAVRMFDYATGDLRQEWISTVHNRYLLLWSEAGFFALLAYLAFCGSVLRRAWQSYRLDDPVLSPLALGLMAGLMGFMLHMNFDLLRSGPPMELFFVLSALVTAIHRLLVTPSVPESRGPPARPQQRHQVRLRRRHG